MTRFASGRRPIGLSIGFLAFVLIGLSAAAEPNRWMMQLKLKDRLIEGSPLAWSERRVLLLGRDGQLWQFSPAEASDYRQTANEFRGYSPAQVRDLLEREFQGSLEVTGTDHYLVAHPAGKGDVWRERFEHVFRSVWSFFSVRGFPVTEPPYPLVAVVWPRRDDYLRYSAAQGSRVGPGIVGYYSPRTNRVSMYDLTAGRNDAAAWRETAATIIHEVAHQVAFNLGVHNRFSTPPQWVVEGLGTFYEAPGAWDAANHPHRHERINRQRLVDFRRFRAGGRPTQTMAEVVMNDDLFQRSPQDAYAEAWALTFFLVETRPGPYCAYLARTAAGREFQTASPEERMRDFVAFFGDNLPLLEAEFLRFIGELK